MATPHNLCVSMLTALLFCKYSLTESNTTTTVMVAATTVTEQPGNRTTACRHNSNRNNCTDSKDTGQWSGHFSKCPKELRHYCIHGVCRYVQEQNTPSCRCERGYVGARCEYVDLGLRVAERRQIIIACVIAGLVFLILLIVFICICTHRRQGVCRRRGRREESRNSTEKLHMVITSAGTHEPPLDATETSHTNTV
ncbi:probetacellulin [Osmerus mordax]|uniref:probetacellulin n=1 Tax=Osmerus mordax TaxID=8014 RepID=UPI00350F1EBE